MLLQFTAFVESRRVALNATRQLAILFHICNWTTSLAILFVILYQTASFPLKFATFASILASKNEEG
jgi:hypothetical protein